MKITALSVNNSVTLFFTMFAIAVVGTISYKTLPREASPDISIPLIFVHTIYPGAAPAEVEQQITRILERELKGIDNLKELRSTSQEGLSSVEVEFISGIDLDVARQKVRDKVDIAKAEFSNEVEEPVVYEINFSTFPILQVHLSGNVGGVRLKQIAEDLEDQIEGIPGVLRANLVGGLEREVQVFVDPEKLRLYHVTLNDVIATIEKEHLSIPGGDIKLGDVAYAVRLPGEVSNPENIANFVIKSIDRKPVFIRDVAQVVYGFKERASYARINGVESVALSIQKRTGANIIEVADEIKRIVAVEQEGWPAGIQAAFLADRSTDIRKMVHDLENNILSGIVLVILVLMFVLGLRQAVFVGMAIPFSMLITFITVQMSGITLNMIVLFSLVLALGMLVDNAIVVIENIYRHMQEGKSSKEAAIEATEEVGGAILVSTLTTLGAFFPLLFWPGIVGDFMYYLPLTVSIALSASLIVALTFNPVLCGSFMRVTIRKKDGLLAKTGKWIDALYYNNLTWALNHRFTVLSGTLLTFILVLTAFVFLNNGVEFFPTAEPSQIYVDIELPPGTKLEKTDRIISELEEKVTSIPDLKTLAASSGAGSQDGFGSASTRGNAQGRIILDLIDRMDRQQSSFLTLEQTRERVSSLPGVTIEVDRPEEGPPVGLPVVIEISGDDFEKLGKIAAKVKELIVDIPHLVSLDDDFEKSRPELLIDLNRTEAARLGLNTQSVASTVRTAVNGTKAGIFRQGENEADITVRFKESSRSTIHDLEQLTIHNENEVPVTLSSVARIHKTESLTSIKHKDQKRVVTISADVTSPPQAAPVLMEVKSRIAKAKDLLPEGYTIQYAGQNKDEDESKEFLSKAFLYALFLVLTLMIAKFNSVRIPLIIITSVLMSMIGVLIGLMVTNIPFGIIMTGLGVISLAGIVVNNAIVLLDYGEQLHKSGLPRRETVLKTGARRMRPVILTAITTLLGLIPLTTGVEFDFVNLQFITGGESSQWWRSMGIAVMFGLAFATFLTLFLVPVLYDFYLGSIEKKAMKLKTREKQL
ncbi:MAG: acriflavin resistance protein [Acidobacteria bacterium]|nr:MAG: acriflavin resistance protein [Acidobacteriota bacterium]